MAAFDALLHWMGYGLCHQLPERSFFGGGIQAPVCARDTGIYLGVITSVILISFLHRGSRPTGLPTKVGWATIAVMIGVMALDGTSQYLGLRASTNELRLITGLTSGFAVGAIITPMINDGLWRRSSAERVLNTAPRLGLWLLGVPTCYALVYWGLPLLGAVYPAVVAVGILATLTAVNLVMVAVLPAFERKASRLSDAWLALLVSLGLSLLEIWSAGLLRTGILAMATSLIS
jgi:uncharacterized membrane protein